MGEIGNCNNGLLSKLEFDDVIKVRIDEWVEKVEFSDEGMFIYLDGSLREDVLEYLEKELGEINE